jgi:hypothetical protein
MDSSELREIANILADYLGELSIPIERPVGLPHLHELDINRQKKWEITNEAYFKVCREIDKTLDREKSK